MGVKRTYADLTEDVTVADAAREITAMWLEDYRILRADENSSIAAVRPSVRAFGTEAVLREGYVFRGTTPLASAVLEVLQVVLAPLGGNGHDTRRAVARLDKLRPTSNRIGIGEGDWYPSRYSVDFTPSKVATLLLIVAGLQFDYTGQKVVPPPEVRIQTALARLAELEQTPDPS